MIISLQLSFPTPLANNGGPTQTVALLPGSSAIDAPVPNPDNPPCVDWNGIALATDQRGGARVVGTTCDVGAYEFGAQAPWVWVPLVVR